MNRRFDIVIAGAGMIGLTAAALLARSSRRDQLNVTVVDAAPRPVFDVADDVALRVSALSPGSVGILEDVGAWNGIASARVSPYRSMRVWDAGGSPDGPEALCFDAAEFALGELGFITENVLVQDRLLGVLQQTQQHLDGVSLVPLLTGATSIDRDALYWHYPHYSNQGGFPGGAIRMDDFKLIERYEDGRVHLYDVQNDIGEREELAAK